MTQIFGHGNGFFNMSIWWLNCFLRRDIQSIILIPIYQILSFLSHSKLEHKEIIFQCPYMQITFGFHLLMTLCCMYSQNDSHLNHKLVTSLSRASFKFIQQVSLTKIAHDVEEIGLTEQWKLPTLFPHPRLVAFWNNNSFLGHIKCMCNKWVLEGRVYVWSPFQFFF